jgi:hypothetical protein
VKKIWCQQSPSLVAMSYLKCASEYPLNTTWVLLGSMFLSTHLPQVTRALLYASNTSRLGYTWLPSW